MRRKITQLLKSLFLEDFVRSCVRKIRRTRRLLFGVDKRLIKEYLRNHSKRKLQLGSGHNNPNGWLNSNFYPKSNKVLHVDATKEYPFPDATFDFVYSEHMIEHIPYAMGLKMLQESFRVLKSQGKVRIVTPDFIFLHELYTKEKTDLQKKYIEINTKMFVKNAPYFADIFVINNFHRDWGHQFIYDADALKKLFSYAGFTYIKQCTLNESEHEDLRNLAHEDRYPAGFLKLESLIIEGTKL
jgi:predicted SAM-dependent methyltransferase